MAGPPKKGMAESLRSFNALLPDRIVDSPNQCLRTILADGKKVGNLWFGVRDKNEAVVWDIVVTPEYRNRGFGSAAMVAMEEELRSMEITNIVLNVFAHNSTAAKMYSQLGYRPVSTKMRKQL